MRTSFWNFLCLCATCIAVDDGSNLRDFYLQLAGFGPVAGETLNGTGTRWIQNSAWRDIVTMSSPTAPDGTPVNATAVQQTRALGWSVTMTQVSDLERRKRRVTTQHTPFENLTASMRFSMAMYVELDDTARTLRDSLTLTQILGPSRKRV